MKVICIIAAVAVAVIFVFIATVLFVAIKEPDDKLFGKLMQANVVLALLASAAIIILCILAEAGLI